MDQQEVQQGTVASVTQGLQRLYHFIKREHRSCQWLLESFDLGSLCWLTFGGKSTERSKFKQFRLIAPKLGPLRREASKNRSNN